MDESKENIATYLRMRKNVLIKERLERGVPYRLPIWKENGQVLCDESETEHCLECGWKLYSHTAAFQICGGRGIEEITPFGNILVIGWLCTECGHTITRGEIPVRE